MRERYRFFIIFFAALFLGGAMLSPAIGKAHGIGASIEKVVGEHTIDIGYNPSEVEAGEQIRFDFDLLKKDGGVPPFTDVWVRITSKDRGIAFAGGLHKPEFGLIRMTYVFPQSGEHELSVRFQNGEETLAEASFPLSVAGSLADAKPSIQLSSQLTVGALIGLVIGFFLSGLLKRNPRSS